MSEQAEPATPLPAARRSRKLTAAVIILAILPLLLPFPFYRLELLWIAPVISEKVLECASFDCQPAVDWYRLAFLMILGPSILVAVASLLLGTIGLFRIHWHPTTLENIDLFGACVACGVVWVVIFGCLLWFCLSALAPALLG